MSDRDGDAAGGGRYVCDACGEWCELLTESDRVPSRCPMGRDAVWESLDEEVVFVSEL